MTDSCNTPAGPRRLACWRCGAVFECRLGGGCWCAGEPHGLPVTGEHDCMCRDCLRQTAAAMRAAR